MNAPHARLRVICTGMIAQYPLGGMTWDFLNYVLGFARLGHDVYYIEDNGQWPYNPTEDGKIKSADFNIAFIQQVMEGVGLGDRWAYKFGWTGEWFGLSEQKREEVIRTADLLVNVSGTLENPDDYRTAKRLAYIDTDPVFTQLKLLKGQRYVADMIERHDVAFSFGECLPGTLPPTGHAWLPTRQPVVVDEFATDEAPRDVYTTVLTWIAYNAMEYDGATYGQKDIEFKRFVDLPERIAPVSIELAANAGRGRKLPRDLLLHKGWTLTDPRDVCPDMDSYRRFIQTSKGEWSVAKNGYVRGESGWFSCRSACYLAAGRPVILQETGFSRVLPVGEGIVSFETLEEAAAAIATVEANYERHAAAARAIAREYFDAPRVLDSLAERAMNA